MDLPTRLVGLQQTIQLFFFSGPFFNHKVFSTNSIQETYFSTKKHLKAYQVAQNKQGKGKCKVKPGHVR